MAAEARKAKNDPVRAPVLLCFNMRETKNEESRGWTHGGRARRGWGTATEETGKRFSSIFHARPRFAAGEIKYRVGARRGSRRSWPVVTDSGWTASTIFGVRGSNITSLSSYFSRRVF